MPRGGDRRPIQRPEGRDLEYAALLMHALCEDKSEAGVRFNQERQALFRKWERLARCLNSYQMRGWGVPPSTLEHFEKYFKSLVNPLTVVYPKPRPLEPAELREYDDRARAINAGLLQSEPGTPEEKMLRWEEKYANLDKWVKDAFDRANPGLKRRRSSRSIVRQYLREVQEFCLRWHLDAWWAGPAIHQSFFFRISLGIKEPLEMYQGGTFISDTYPIVVKLPGSLDAEYETDSIRFRNLWLENAIGAEAGDIVVRKRPDRQEMAILEERNDASCVVIDWDGRDHYPSRYSPDNRVTPSHHVVEECEARMDRRMSKRETRELLSQVDPQFAEARTQFRNLGWTALGAVNLGQVAA